MIEIRAPFKNDDIEKLVCGDIIKLSGVIYTARDAAHKRMIDAINNNEKLPFDVDGSGIYYVGPSPNKKNQVIGSAGPTTSYRMDKYAPVLLDLGLKGMIGKGARSEEVIEGIKRNKAIYFGAIGGAGALISKCIISSEIVAYEDLGAEAIRRIEVKDMPLTVIIDSEGNNLYEIGKAQYLKSI